MQGSKELYPCRFCGTAVIVMGGVDPEEYAARNCTCAESKEYRRERELQERKEESMEAAFDAIEEVIFNGSGSEDQRNAAAEVLRAAVPGLVNSEIVTVTVTAYGEKFKISYTSKGKTKIERTQIKSISKEV